MKKFLTAIILSLLIGTTAQAAGEPRLAAESAILVEASTGRIIFEKNADVQHEPASMTKMLTCVLALEQLDPSEEVVMGQAAVLTEDNTLNWATGDSVSARDMVTAVMLVSENGGAVALAQTISGGESQFAGLMNDKAKALGCTRTHFSNPNRRRHGTHCRLLHEEPDLP